MYSGVYWGTGSRPVNEDSVVLEDVRTDRGQCTLLAVCDGIGTYDYGEIASGYVAECIVTWFYRTGISLKNAPASKIKRSVNKCLYDCHLDLKAKAKEAGIKWGSTCTLVCIWNSRFICAHLGDSAALKVNHGKARPLTSPHRNDRGELTKCVGSQGYQEPDISFGHLPRGSGILIASDGFDDRLGAADIEGMLDLRGELTNEYIERRLSAIASENKARGGRDNMSAVYAIR